MTSKRKPTIPYCDFRDEVVIYADRLYMRLFGVPLNRGDIRYAKIKAGMTRFVNKVTEHWY